MVTIIIVIYNTEPEVLCEGKRQFLSLYLFEFIIIYGLVLGQGSINKCFIQSIIFFASLELLAGAAAIFYA
jgi:hypothetical protein